MAEAIEGFDDHYDIYTQAIGNLYRIIAVVDGKTMSFNEFVDWYPADSENRYELRRGAVIQVPKPKGKHSQLSSDLAYELGTTIRQLEQPFFIPRE